MISKKKIKERLLDLCNGAGMPWDEECGYFDCRDDILECIARLIPAIEFAFDIENDAILRTYYLPKFNEIDTLVDLVEMATQEETSE